MGCVDWIDLAQDRGKWKVFVKPFMNLLVPQDDGHFLIGFKNISFSRRISFMECFRIQAVFD
jgi:hypothetical protein